MKVYFIGAGPGDPELLTIKGKKALEEAEVIIYTGSLVNPEILDYAPRAEVYNSAVMTLDEILTRIEDSIEQGKIVARVHTGDPSIYGAIQEQIDYLKEKGIEYEIIPGVSSFLAAAAAVEREFTLPDVSQTLILTRLEGKTPVPEKERLSKLAEHNASMAIFLSVQMIEGVVEELKRSYPEKTPVAVIYKASWPEEKIVRGTLVDIVFKVKKAGIRKTAMILVGNFLDCNYSKSRLYAEDFGHKFRQASCSISTGNLQKDPGEKAILVVSFGTSYPETRAVTIEACERKIERTFKDYEIRRAFTSEMIIKKLKERDNIFIDNPKEALVKLKDEGFSEVIIQPLHIINGWEYNDLVKEAASFRNDFNRLVFGEPLLSGMEDYLAVAEALKAQIPELQENEAVVWMGHGTDHPANSAYACLDYVFKDMGLRNVFIGTVEGYPELDRIIEKLKTRRINKVILMPLMLVAGDHAKNDLAGEGEDSWKTILRKEGFAVETYLHGLGENEGIQNIYLDHVRKAIENSSR